MSSFRLVPLAVLALACGAVVHEPAACTPSGPPTREPSVAPNASGRPSYDAGALSSALFESLAARGPAVAPGMREASRRESAGERVEIAHADGHDTCVRVVFEATGPVVARLMDGEGNVLASMDKAATDGVLGVGGPVCVRKGDGVSAVAVGAGTSVRWVAWEAP